MGMCGGKRNGGACGFAGRVGGTGRGWNAGMTQASDFSEKEILQRREELLDRELKQVKERLATLTPKVDEGQR